MNDLARARRSKGYTQQQVADKLGVTGNHYSKIERGVTSLISENAYRLAKILEAPLAVVLGIKPALSSDEEELLDIFRDCDEKQKAMQVIKIICEEHKAKSV